MGPLPSPHKLPDYAVLLPVHKEANMLRRLMARIADLQYPRERLHVYLLIDHHEAAILSEASRTVDLLDDLQTQIDENGLILDSHGGRINPAVVEARQQRLALLKLISALHLPVDVLDDDAPRRPSRASADRS